MYAVKPWGKVMLVGRGVASLSLGIGMRWRESEVEIIEKIDGPYGELNLMRRCVLPENTIKQMEDLGVSKEILRGILRPAKNWKFIGALGLETIREGSLYPGCSPMEPVYHCTEGRLVRLLRQEFMKFGGRFEWGSTAYDAFESADGSHTWTLRKDYGPGANAQSIISFCNNDAFNKLVLVDDPQRLAVLFDVRTGVLLNASEEVNAMLGASFDVTIAIGNGVALHMWRTMNHMEVPVVAWKLICKGRTDFEQLLQGLHPTLREVVGRSINVQSTMQRIPASTPAIRDDAHHHRISVMGDALLPVDPFEWRGDAVRTAIEEASALVRGIYGSKYHRGHIPQILRSTEQDVISRRAFLLRRDLVDAEHFLAVNPQLPPDDDEADETLKRVSA
jgi:hypothetical protein